MLSCHADKLTDDGRRRLVRHGHLPEREIMTGIGPVAVRCPRVRDRGGEGSERIRFSSAILPPYARRSKSLEVLIPILYLKGISSGDFEDALITLLGRDAGGLSASTIGRLKEAWSEEHTRWSKRDLSAKRYIYFWVDGIHVQARLEDTAQCLLIIIGATPEGRKELVGLTDGVRESAQSWRELLLDLKRRGLSIGPELAVADGALGFWQAVEEVWPQTRGQRCWVHKTANVLNKLPNSQQPKAKRALQEIWMAETKKDALAAFDAFVETWGVKYDKAVECLIKDRDALLAMIFKLAEAAERSWRRLNGHNQLPKIILGIKFSDGIEVVRSQAQPLPPDPFRHQNSAIALKRRKASKDRNHKPAMRRGRIGPAIRAPANAALAQVSATGLEERHGIAQSRITFVTKPSTSAITMPKPHRR